MGWFDKTALGIVLFPVLEQKSLNIEVLYCPGSSTQYANETDKRSDVSYQTSPDRLLMIN